MTEERALTIQPEPGLLAAPRDVVTAAREQATVLMEIVEDKKLYQAIGGKKYLEAEAWETILAFNNVHPVPRSVTPIVENGDITGYWAQVDLMKAGEIVSSGIMPCGFDDFPCRGKEGTAKHKAAMSAAQTWALSKAARMKFAWIVVLAGYAPTPADEVGETGGKEPKRRKPLLDQAREILGAGATPICVCGSKRIFRSGTRQNGSTWRGWMCPTGKDAPVWIKDDADKVSPLEEDDPSVDPRGDPMQLTPEERRML